MSEVGQNIDFAVLRHILAHVAEDVVLAAWSFNLITPEFAIPEFVPVVTTNCCIKVDIWSCEERVEVHSTALVKFLATRPDQAAVRDPHPTSAVQAFVD